MQTANIILRQVMLDDFEDFYEIISSNKITDDMQPVVEKQKAKDLLIKTLELAKQNKKFTFGMILKQNKKLIGFIDLAIKDKLTGELSCVVHPDYWNKGYGSEAMLEIQNFALEKMKLKRLCGVCSLFNSSCSSLFKNVLGFEYKKTEQVDNKDYLYFEKVKK